MVPLNKSIISSLEKLIFFLGYPRSGHSLVGSLIDAHPHAVVADEYNMADVFIRRQTITRKTLFSEIVSKTRMDAKVGSRQNDVPTASPSPGTYVHYNYNVPGQWQGKFSGHIKVTELISRLPVLASSRNVCPARCM